MLKQINVNSFDSPQAGTTILSPNASTSVGAVAVSDLKKEFSKAQLQRENYANDKGYISKVEEAAMLETKEQDEGPVSPQISKKKFQFKVIGESEEVLAAKKAKV